MHWLPSAALVCHSFAVRAIFCASYANNASAFVRIRRHCLSRHLKLASCVLRRGRHAETQDWLHAGHVGFCCQQICPELCVSYYFRRLRVDCLGLGVQTLAHRVPSNQL